LNYLRAERTRLGLTQRQIAALSGVNHSSVSLWETGRRRPRAQAAGRLVAIFDRPLDDLLRNENGAASDGDDPCDSTPRTAKNSEPCHAS